MASTYEKIATTTLGSAAANITFSSITGSYTDLVLIVQGGGSSSGYNFCIRFNSDTGSNYSVTRLRGNGSTASSDRGSNLSYIYTESMTTNTDSNFIININNYSNSNTYKTALIRANNVPDSRMGASVGLWRNTAAITSISISPEFSINLISGTTATLYGILKA